MNLILTKRTGIKAYTIMEVLITMIVSSIAITLIIGLFLSNQKALIQYIQTSDRYNNKMNFLTVLKTDITNCSSISKKSDGFELTYQASFINYVFTDFECIRTSEIHSDTFDIKINHYEWILLDQSDIFIDFIKLNLNIEAFEKEITFSKEYSKDFLFKLDHEHQY